MEKDQEIWLHVIHHPFLNRVFAFNKGMVQCMDLQCFLTNSDPSILQSFGGSAHDAFFSGWDIEPLQKTALYFSLWAAKEVILNLFKYWLMVKAFGMSKVCPLSHHM